MNYASSRVINALSQEQQKALLQNTHYYIRNSNPRIWGRVIGWATDHRGFGAVVGYGNGLKGFFGVDPRTMKVVDLGTPPSRG